MNKAIGILVIGLGMIMIVIGVMGTQSQILADIKAVNPKLRQATGAGGGSTTTTGGTVNSTGTTATQSGQTPSQANNAIYSGSATGLYGSPGTGSTVQKPTLLQELTGTAGLNRVITGLKTNVGVGNLAGFTGLKTFLSWIGI